MALINRFINWLKHIRNCFLCGSQGHGNVVILHEYKGCEFYKFTGQIEGEKFKNVICQDGNMVTAKCHCKQCGETFLRTYFRPQELQTA